jgi:thiopurine S-methyltransferase
MPLRLDHQTSPRYYGPMHDQWLERWETGQTGWHEPSGNRNLQAHWTLAGRRVLVPLCGKTPDLLWLESRGNEVVGVELSEIAVLDFFKENKLEYERVDGALPGYRATSHKVTLYCGDYFEFHGETFDAHYDRGALIALSPDLRSRYAAHTSSLLADEAAQFVVTVEYDDAVATGPPFSVLEEEILSYWPSLEEKARVSDIENAPPKFIASGLEQIHEVVWTR